jgi:hypothetical protein
MADVEFASLITPIGFGSTAKDVEIAMRFREEWSRKTKVRQQLRWHRQPVEEFDGGVVLLFPPLGYEPA